MSITRTISGLALLLGCAQALAAIPIQHWVQPSGAKVYLVESPSIPMVDVRLEFDAGARREPAEKAGLASVTAGMTSKGLEARNGEPALDENQLGEAWADLGAGFGAGAGSDRMSFSLRSLTYPDLLPANWASPHSRRPSGSASARGWPRPSGRPIPARRPWPAGPMPPRSTAAIRMAMT